MSVASEERLRQALREAPVPGAEDAERRGLAMVEAAFAERRPRRRSPAPRLAVAFAVALLAAALLLSPAGASIRDWVDGVFADNPPPRGPALTEVPGGGRLLVQAGGGAWVVQPDGSRRLLGPYGEASWSPRGLFVAAAAGHTLSAIEPGGTVHWTISAPGAVADPRWSPSALDNVRIAYRSGDALRVVHADGSDDSPLARPVAPVAPAWSPLGLHALAYAGGEGRLRFVQTDARRPLGSAAALPGLETIGWAPGGGELLEASQRALRTRPIARSGGGPFMAGPPRPIALPPGAIVLQAGFSPREATIAALLALPAEGGRPPRSELVLARRGHRPQVLLTVPGHLTGFLWSPGGSRLLVSWRELDEWLFIPAEGRGEGRRYGPISAEFSPGSAPGEAEFPRLEGWCCVIPGAAPQR